MGKQQVVSPQTVWREYESGRQFKSGLGELGLYEQNRRNERFFVGDQWHGAKCGGERPLVRHNVIKRIGEFKIAAVGSTPLTVAYSAEGLESDLTVQQSLRAQFEAAGKIMRADTMMTALSKYFRVSAERVKLDDCKAQVLEDAYIGGTGYLHTYWDPTVQTGLFADQARLTPIMGDIQVEILDVENVYMGDPSCTDLQKQPYILIVQRKRVKELRETAKRYGASDITLEDITPDSEWRYMAGDRSQTEPQDSKKATVITRLWKENGKNGRVTVKGMQVCENAVIRKEWDLGIRLYPIAAFCWQKRKNCAYGDSEVTHLIPNQIAINRMITASVWAVMMMGIPMTVVNGDVVQQEITNDPGQMLRVYGSAEEVASAVRYVDPPQFSPQFNENIQSLITNTLSQAGANEITLGDVRPDNTSAILAVHEVAMMPLQTVKNRYYSFLEDVARIWAEFWIMKYGSRSLKMEDESGVWYLPFEGETYRDLVLSARIDVGAAGLWSEVQTVTTLDKLLSAEVITPLQYLKRLPDGVVPDVHELIGELQKASLRGEDVKDENR